MDKIITFLGLKNGNDKINHLFAVFLLLSIFLFFSMVYDMLQIHIYRHDSLYYMTDADTYYRFKVATEGRWINYIFFNILTRLSGEMLSIFIVCSFGYFIFTALCQWSKDHYYSLMVSLFFIQFPPLYNAILWPATSAPALAVLLLAVFLQKKLNLFLYFVLFGILFFGTISNYYYLLPLLFLRYFLDQSSQQNVVFFVYKLIPAWAAGFVSGYVVAQVIVYMDFGHFITIAGWRAPHYIHSFHDLGENIQRSVHFLKEHIKLVFSHHWFIILFLFSFAVSITGRRKDILFLPLTLFFLILIVHYAVIIPIGIDIAPRTAISTWIGIFGMSFFIPFVKKWQIYVLVPVIVLLTFTLYLDNHHNLQWYRTITNTYYDRLLSESPNSPAQYKGIILYASDTDIKKRNQLIAKIHHISAGNTLENLDAFGRWVPVAREAGFKTVMNCNGEKGRNVLWHPQENATDICKRVSQMVLAAKNMPNSDLSFYHIVGEYNGKLIIAFNKHWDHR